MAQRNNSEDMTDPNNGAHEMIWVPFIQDNIPWNTGKEPPLLQKDPQPLFTNVTYRWPTWTIETYCIFIGITCISVFRIQWLWGTDHRHMISCASATNFHASSESYRNQSGQILSLMLQLIHMSMFTLQTNDLWHTAALEITTGLGDNHNDRTSRTNRCPS